jgi:sigma-E factor negative regulatory protein RseA
MSEQISALMDDEIAVEDASRLIAVLQSSKQATEAWGEYHLIGDIMRGEALFNKDFKQNLMQMIELEPTVLAPQAAQYNSQKFAELKDKLPVKWSIAASFAAVMVVGWMALQQQVQPETGAPMMEMAELEVVEQSIPNEYLTAHQASAPSTSSYYIQSVNYAE